MNFKDIKKELGIEKKINLFYHNFKIKEIKKNE